MTPSRLRLVAILESALLGAGAAYSLDDLRAWRFPNTAPEPYRGKGWRDVIEQSLGDVAATGLGLPWQCGRFLRRCYDEHLLAVDPTRLPFRETSKPERVRTPRRAGPRLVLEDGGRKGA